MEEFFKKLLSKVILEFGLFFSTIPKIFSAPNAFFSSIDESNETFIRASSFVLVLSCIFVLLSIPSYKNNGISTESEFLLIAIVFNWLLFLIGGILVWFSCQIVRGKSQFNKCLSAFFYSCSILVVVKFLEIPARIIRDNILVNSKLTSDLSEKMTEAVTSNSYSFASEIMVGLGYVWFLFILFVIFRETHKLGWLRSILGVAITITPFSLLISWIQRPIAHALLTAYMK